jgi:malate permease and related proteins
MLEQIFSIVFPLFAIVTVGFLYGRCHAPDMAAANQLNLDIFVPALIFHVLSAKNFQLALYQELAIAGVVVVIGSGLLAWPLAKLLNFNLKTFVPPMMFSNSGNMGLPLALFAFGEKALPAAVVLFIVENTLHFSVGMKMMDRRTSIINILRIPMVVATLAGMAFSMTDWVLPNVLSVSIEMVGQVAIPLMLFSLGVRLTGVDFKDWRIGVSGAIICPATGIIMVLLISPLLDLNSLQYGQLLIFGALPPAVLNFMVAEKYGQQPGQVASIVMLGNLGSLIIIPITLAYVLV